MIISFVLMSAIAGASGGAGLAAIQKSVRWEGYDYSKYRIKNALAELVKIGAVAKVGKSYSLTLLGANLVAADIAAANGWEVIREGDYGMKMPVYQKGL